MNIFRKPITIIFVLFCYAGINFEGIFGNKATIIVNITYLVRLMVTFFSIISFLVVQRIYIKNNKLHTYFIIFIFYLMTILSSLVSGNLNIDILAKYSFALGLYFYIIYCSYKYKNLIKGLQLFYISILFLNILFYIFIPEIGIYTVSDRGIPLVKGVLTNRNSVLLYSLPLLTLNNIIKYDSEKGIRYVIVNFISIVVSVLTGSTTAIVVIAFYIFTKIVYNKKEIRTHLYVFIMLLLFASILFTDIEANFLGRIIGNFLGSDLTLSGRTIIWDKVIRLIPTSLIFGYGIGSFDIAEALFYKTATNGMPLNDPFNGILNILFFNGLLGLVVFLLIIKNMLMKLNYSQKNDKKATYFIIFFLSSFLISISESIFTFTNVNFWIFIILAYEYNYNHEKLLAGQHYQFYPTINTQDNYYP